MELETVFNPAFQKALLAETEASMRLAVQMQARLSEPGFLTRKHDNSPVTEADHAVQARIEAFLAHATPAWPMVGEETAHEWIASDLELPEVFWLCDPIDGTQDYAANGREYAINIALIQKGRAVFGLIAGPGQGAIAYTDAPDSVTYIEAGYVRKLKPPPKRDLQHATLIIGHGRKKDVSAYEDIIGQPVSGVIHRASAMKFHALLLGDAHVYLRVRETSEWDIAAGDALVTALGGRCFEIDRKTPLAYGHKDKEFKLNSVFVTMGEA